jgi:hypothetical protein
MTGVGKIVQNCHCDPARAGEAILLVNSKISRNGSALLMFLSAQKRMGKYVGDCFTRLRSFAMTAFCHFSKSRRDDSFVENESRKKLISAVGALSVFCLWL